MTQPLHDLLASHRLTPAQRRIAGYLMDHRAEAAALTSSELAEHASVSQPSVTRFVALLGFERYAAFRRYLLRAAVAVPDESRNAGHATKFQAAIDADIGNLIALREQLADDRPLNRIAALLMSSDPLPVLGFRVSAAPALSFGYLAAKIHPDVRTLTDAGSVLGDQLRRLQGSGARAIVLFALPRYPRETREALVAATELGLKTVLITDRPLSVLTPEADEVLSAGVASAFVLDSHAAITSLSVALVEAMADAGGASAQERLESFEDYAAAQRIFVAE